MGIVLLAGVLLAGWALFIYNRLTRLRQLAQGAWADIDVQLKRRHDLVPQVVATVQGHAGYERSTLEAVVEARNRAARAEGPADRARAEEPVAGGLQRIVALAEAYPDLRAMASFRQLQDTLTDVETHLQQARRYYNAVVRDYNTAREQFPASLVAGLANFPPREFFGLADDAERAVPDVRVEGR